MSLNGIDIASYQSDLVVSKMTTTQFVIVKATESNWYVNECFEKHAQQVVKSGKLLGCYHFARPGDMVEQADYFLGTVKKYIGKAVLALDWEENAIPLGPKKAKQWLDRVYRKTGVRPVIYMSKSVCNAYDWSAVKAAGYELWVAQYPDYERTGYKAKTDIWTDSSLFGAWRDWPILFQYTSVGRVRGYSGNLDLDCFGGTVAKWNRMAKNAKAKTAVTKVTTAKPPVTTSKITKMVNHGKDLAADDSHGYTQDTGKRWGPDYDCASFIYACAKFAGYNVKTGQGKYTGTMIDDFKAAGFKVLEFDGVLSDLDPGDILLRDPWGRDGHTEMYVGNGKMVGAHCSETGGAYGKTGDQTGNEISVCNVYDAGWDYVLVPPAESGSSAPRKTVDELAHEVINRKWGNGAARKRKLEAAGYDYEAVQARVNELLL